MLQSMGSQELGMTDQAYIHTHTHTHTHEYLLGSNPCFIAYSVGEPGQVSQSS